LPTQQAQIAACPGAGEDTWKALDREPWSESDRQSRKDSLRRQPNFSL